MFPLIFDLLPVGGFHPSTDAIRTMFSLRWLCPPDHPDSPNQSPWLLTLNWPLTLTISNNDNCFFLPTIQPQFLYHILVNIWHVTAFVQETINLQTSLHVSEWMEQYARQYSSVHVLALFHTYWTCFPLSGVCQPSPPWTQELFSPREVANGVCPCIHQFHTLWFKYMSHWGALSSSNVNTVQVSLPSPTSFYVPFPWTHHISKLGVFGCMLKRGDHVSLLRCRNKTWLSSFLLHFQHWTNHA